MTKLTEDMVKTMSIEKLNEYSKILITFYKQQNIFAFLHEDTLYDVYRSYCIIKKELILRHK